MSSILNAIKSKWRFLSNTSPLVRGMVSYAVIWPTANVIQQTIEGKNLKTYDWIRAMRFGVYGSLYVVPTWHCWMRFSSVLWPVMSLKVAVIKSMVEQITYTPFGFVSFFYIMNLWETGLPEKALQEVKEKFWPTYTTGLCFWPLIQIINYSVVPERNRLVFVSFCSLFWTIFLAHMKSKDITIPSSQKLRKN